MSDAAQSKAYMPTKAAQEDWNTPEEVLVPVRKVFGGEIDWDPCGNPGSIVQAKRQVWLPKWAELRPMAVADVITVRNVDRVINPPIVFGRDLPPNVIVGDGLQIPWSGSTFVNPPYSAKPLSAFMARARDAAARGVPVIMLTKVKLIKGWHASVPAAPAVCFLNRRLTFHGCSESAPFDCALILWTRSRTLVNRFALEMEAMGDTMFHLGGR